MTFNINMNTEGGVATTIPYDNGFEIKIDGEEVQVKKINGLYIGADIERGKHMVERSYHIPGFKVGLSLLLIGFIILISIFFNDVKRTRKMELLLKTGQKIKKPMCVIFHIFQASYQVVDNKLCKF